MTEPSLLPPRRELPAPTADRIRARVLAGTSRPAPTQRRWLPLAAAAAVVALVAGAVAVAGRNPDAPPAAPAPSPTAVSLPSLTEVSEQCGVLPVYDYVTRYQGDGAVTWLFIEERSKASAVCTWKIGSTGGMANFMNDWYWDGMAPAADGQLHATFDDMAPHVEDGATHAAGAGRLERDRWVLVGTVPAGVVRVGVVGADGQERSAAFGSSWYLYHYRGHRPTKIYGYDADGQVVVSG